MILITARFIALIAVISSAYYWWLDRNAERLSMLCAAIVALLALFIAPKAKKTYSVKQTQNVGSNSTGYQANGNININKKRDAE